MRSEIVEFILVALERDGLEEVDGDAGLRRAAQPEDGPVAQVGDHKTHGEDHGHANQPTLDVYKRQVIEFVSHALNFKMLDARTVPRRVAHHVSM